MIITSSDPIRGKPLHHPDLKPIIAEGKGCLAVKTHLESGETRRSYLQRQHTAAPRTVRAGA